MLDPRPAPVINGDGNQTRDYTYVDDVVNAVMFALRHDRSAMFNVGTGVETDVNTLFSLLRKAPVQPVRRHTARRKQVSSCEAFWIIRLSRNVRLEAVGIAREGLARYGGVFRKTDHAGRTRRGKFSRGTGSQ